MRVGAQRVRRAPRRVRGVPAAAPAALRAPRRPLGHARLQDAAPQGWTQQVPTTLLHAPSRRSFTYFLTSFKVNLVMLLK